MIHQSSKSVTTNGSGDATVYTGKHTGRIVAIKYDPGTIVTGADLTITGENTGVPILVKADAGTSVVWFFPKVLVSENTDGANATDAFADLFLYRERAKLVVAQGGATKTGTITIFVDE